MCDAYTPAGEPIPTNKRHSAAKIFSHPEVAAEEPWYLLFENLIVIFHFQFSLHFRTLGVLQFCFFAFKVWY